MKSWGKSEGGSWNEEASLNEALHFIYLFLSLSVT
jgi:hypothetical protein